MALLINSKCINCDSYKVFN